MFEWGHQELVPTADVDEGPAHATSPTCAELAAASCSTPPVAGLTSTMTPGGIGWLAGRPLSYDFYAVVYDIAIKGAPVFEKGYPGWRAVPVANVNVTVVTRQQAEATGVTDGDDTVEHFHRAAVSSAGGFSIVQAILPCLAWAPRGSPTAGA
jgi:hypothetical protein